MDRTGHARRFIGYFIMTHGDLAPDGGYRQCRVEATPSGQIVLAPLDEGSPLAALIRTVTLAELDQLLTLFTTPPAARREGTG